VAGCTGPACEAVRAGSWEPETKLTLRQYACVSPATRVSTASLRLRKRWHLGDQATDGAHRRGRPQRGVKLSGGRGEAVAALQALLQLLRAVQVAGGPRVHLAGAGATRIPDRPSHGPGGRGGDPVLIEDQQHHGNVVAAAALLRSRLDNGGAGGVDVAAAGTQRRFDAIHQVLAVGEGVKQAVAAQHHKLVGGGGAG
jgi:hypothetical protein